jgi:broad specificity phosphatase PhoE
VESMVNPWAQPAAWIVRHGETDLNATDCYRGWENPQLNEAGIEAARQIANFFSYEPIGRIVSSDLDRAMQTAEYILSAGTAQIPYVSPDFNLRPWGIAAFAGQEKTPANQRKLAYYIRNCSEKIPDGESLDEFNARQEETLDPYIATPYDGLPTVIVTHTSNLTHLASRVDLQNGKDPEHDPEVHDIVEPGGVVAVYLDTDGKITLVPRLGAIEREAEPQVS